MDPTHGPSSPMIARSLDSAKSTALRSSSKPRPEEEASIPPHAQPDAVVDEIREHLLEGRFRSAQGLAKAAAARFPEHPEIRKLNRGLNEWTARTKPASGRDMSEEFAWLCHPPVSTRGKWVALIGSEMVGAADTLAELVEYLRSESLPEEPLVHRID